MKLNQITISEIKERPLQWAMHISTMKIPHTSFFFIHKSFQNCSTFHKIWKLQAIFVHPGPCLSLFFRYFWWHGWESRLLKRERKCCFPEAAGSTTQTLANIHNLYKLYIIYIIYMIIYIKPPKPLQIWTQWWSRLWWSRGKIAALHRKWVEQIAMLCISASPLQRRVWSGAASQEFDKDTNQSFPPKKPIW